MRCVIIEETIFCSLANNISEEHDEDDDPETENEFQSETSDNIPTKSVSLKAVSRKQTQRAVSKKSKTKAATEGSEEEFEFSFFGLSCNTTFSADFMVIICQILLRVAEK